MTKPERRKGPRRKVTLSDLDTASIRRVVHGKGRRADDNEVTQYPDAPWREEK